MSLGDNTAASGAATGCDAGAVVSLSTIAAAEKEFMMADPTINLIDDADRTPPVVSKVRTPKKLNKEQRAMVSKLIKTRYNVLNNVVQNIPRPKQINLPNEAPLYQWESIQAGLIDVPEDVRSAHKEAVAAASKYNSLRGKYARQNAESVSAHDEKTRALRSRLYREEQGSQAALLLDDAAQEVRQYLDALPALDSIMSDLKQLGMDEDKAKQLVLTDEPPTPTGRRY